VISEQQSAAFNIRNAMFGLLTADPTFAGYVARKTKMLPVQPDLLPFLGVYFIEENMAPDGDANEGCIRFEHTARFGFSVIAVNNDQDVLEQTIDKAFLKIMAILWTDLKLTNVLQSSIPEGYLIESIVRGARRFSFGPASFNNELPLGELQYEVSCFYRSEWYPDIPDMLDEIDVTTGVKAGDTQTEMNQRQQVSVKYTGLNTLPVAEMFKVLRNHVIREEPHGASNDENAGPASGPAGAWPAGRANRGQVAQAQASIRRRLPLYRVSRMAKR
jgi:hypothetical protein